jgi:uncharacterized protein YjbJ (UPF0337 family)
MNENQLKGQWQQTKGKIQEKWGRITNDDLDVIAGKRDQLAGLLRKRYGAAEEEIERQIREFEDQHATV